MSKGDRNKSEFPEEDLLDDVADHGDGLDDEAVEEAPRKGKAKAKKAAREEEVSVGESPSLYLHSALLLSGRLLNRMLNWYNSIFSLTPKDKAKMYRNLSRRAIVCGEPAEAIRYLKEWAKHDKGDIEPIYQMGVALSMMGDFARAIGAFDRVLKQRPGHTMAAYRRSAVLLKLKKYPEAVAGLERVVESKSDDARAFYLLGLAYEGMGDLEKGVAAMSRAVELDPEEIKYHQHLGFMNVRRDDHKTAAEHFTKVMELERESSGEES